MKRRTIVSLAVLAIAVTGCAAQDGKVHVSEAVAAVNAEDRLALKGYDPVAYFTEGKPVKGDPSITAAYRGARYQFASGANRDRFGADPAHFAPQYGGYCAYAVSRGGVADTDPNAWAIVQNKLYLNYNFVVRTLWDQDRPGNITAADKNWPLVPKKALPAS